MHILAMLAVLGTATSIETGTIDVIDARFQSKASIDSVRAVACAMAATTTIGGRQLPITMSVGDQECPGAAPLGMPLAITLESGVVTLETHAMASDAPAVRETVGEVRTELARRLALLPPPPAPSAPAPKGSSPLKVDHTAEIVGGVFVAAGITAGIAFAIAGAVGSFSRRPSLGLKF